MTSTDIQHADWELKPGVLHPFDRRHLPHSRRGSPPIVEAFRKRRSTSRILHDTSLYEQTDIEAYRSSSSDAVYELRRRRPRHIPIVITPGIIESVLKDLPDSPKHQDGEERPVFPVLFESGREDASLPLTISQRPRHIPIVIPTFAQPYSLFPPTPSGSECNTPRVSPPAPHSCELSLRDMARPATNESRTRTFDSDVSIQSPSQMYSAHFKPSSSAYPGGVNSSHSSLNQDIASDALQNADTVSPPSKFGGTTPYSGGPSPAVSQSFNGTTNLSGLVCNVHRTTGNEPHALVGATTSILGDKLYVFGGRILSRRRPQLTSDLYELDLIRRHWTKVETIGDTPTPRYFHSVCTLGDTKLICYGGMSPSSLPSNQLPSNTAQQQANPLDSQSEVVVLSDIHIYDAPTRTWTYIPTTNTPQGRYAHCAAVLPSSATFTSANAPLSAIHHNPASSNPNQGSIGVALDGKGGAEMVVVGGQDNSNHYIEQINVFNLRSLKWTSAHTLGRSCGAYRSVIVPLTSMPASSIGSGPDQLNGSENSLKSSDSSNESSSMLIYSNYNFLDVKLELQVRLSDGSLAEKPMNSQFSPPGLRFPNGGVLDNNFVVSGTYLTSSKQEYALWALDLKTLSWSRIDVGGSVFSQGSWNRGVLWPRRNTFVILGNRKRSLVEDYHLRRINFSNICMVELEAFGLYENPRRASPTSAYPSFSAPVLPPSLIPKPFSYTAGGRPYFSASIELGQMAMNFRELADMDLLAISGERIPVNSQLLARRWGPYFLHLLHEAASSTPKTSFHDGVSPSSEATTLQPQPNQSRISVSNSRNSSLTITPSLGTTYSATASTLAPSTAHSTTTSITKSPHLEPLTTLSLPPLSRPRTLYLPHTNLTLQSLIHYLYTSSLPPLNHQLCTPQILCSLLQLARPYRVDGLLEAVVERLHQVLDRHNAAAVFNATAMAAGGGRGTGFGLGEDGATRGEDLDKMEGLMVKEENGVGGDGGGESEEDEGSSVSGSLASSLADSELVDTDIGMEAWTGEGSCVVGLQKRGLRGLMEGRRMMRERGRSAGAGVGAGAGASASTGWNGVGEGRVGLGIV
ncbi:hypothetical protein MMC12_001980 [Toensbergia leucococca]|nr:hypothetical protein [Toensbergia leucococca]